MSSLFFCFVIPAEAGIHLSAIAKVGPWIPIFIGMTTYELTPPTFNKKPRRKAALAALSSSR